MTIEQFERVITDRMLAVETERNAAVASMAIEMEGRERLAAAFVDVAGRLHEAIVLPRVTVVMRQFADAHVGTTATPFGMRTECQLPRSARYPAHTKLSLSIARSPDGTKGFVTYSLEIVPILMAFHGECHVEFDPASPDETAIAEWVEQRLCEVVETYLRIGSEPQYQRDNQSVDPVCGMSISAATVDEQFTVHGHVYYFGSVSCRERFAAAPATYLERTNRIEATA